MATESKWERRKRIREEKGVTNVTQESAKQTLEDFEASTSDIADYVSSNSYSSKDDGQKYLDELKKKREELDLVSDYYTRYGADKETIFSLSNYYEYLNSLEKGVGNKKNYFSQWETEKDHKNYLDQVKEQERLEYLNVKEARDKKYALEQELKGLKEQEKAQYKKAGTASVVSASLNPKKGTSSNVLESYVDSDLVEKRKALQNEIDALDRDINLASRKQTNKYLTDRAVSAEDFGEYSFNPIIPEKEYNIYKQANQERDNSAERFMTEDEKAIYNYYFNKVGEAKAEEYLDSIQEDLNFRQAKAIFKGNEDNVLAQLALMAPTQGLEQSKSGFQGALRMVMGDDSYQPVSTYDYLGQMAKEDLADKGFKLPEWMGGQSIGQLAYDLVNTGANMAPSIAVGALTGMGSLAFGASAAGNAYTQKINEGYSKDQATAYGVIIGVSEATLEKVVGAIGFGGKTLASKAVAKLLPKIDKAAARIAVKYGSSMLSEGVEEGLQEVLEPLYRNAAFGENNELEITEDAIYSALLGALSGGLMEGTPYAISEGINASYQNKINEKYGKSVGEIVTEGLSAPEGTRSHELAQEYKAKIEDGKTLSGAEIRLMVEANEEQFTIDDTAKIQEAALNRLKELGESDNVDAIAQVLAKQAGGEVITKAEQRTLDASTYGQRVANELNPENIQSGGYSSDWTGNIGTNRINADLYNLAREAAGTKATQDAPKATQEKAEAKIDSSETNSLPKEGKAVQSEFEVSDNGKTFNLDTGDDIKIADIASIKGGKMTLKLEDGTEVSTDKVSFGNTGEALVYETVANLPNINAATANVLVKNLDLSDVSASVYARGIEEAYRFGTYNIPVAEMMADGAFARDLSEQQRMQAYRIGQSNSKAATLAKNATVRKDRTVESTTGQVKKAYSKAGKVHFDGDREALNQRQKTSIKVLERIASVLGVEIYLFESPVVNGKRQGANGWYDKKDGSIHLDIYAGQNGEATILFTAAHELVHFLKDRAPAKFDVLADFLMEEYGKKGVSVDELVRAQQAKARRNGRELSYGDAYEEVIADSMETMLADGKVMEKLAKLKAKDQTLWEHIKSFIDDLVNKIKEVYAGLSPNSAEGRYVAEMKDSLERIQELFTEGLIEASENMQTIGGIDLEQFADAKNTEGEQLFQYRAMEADEDTYRSMLKKWGKFSDAQINNLFTTIDKAMDIIKDNLEVLDYAWEADINDRAFSPVKPNSDSLYQVSIDFSTLCRKRLLQQTVQAQLQEALKRPMTKEEGIAIRDALIAIQEEGRQIEIACALCYVESARMKSPAQIKKFLENREAVLKDFFASKSGGDIKGKIKQAEADARERLGVGDASLNSLTKKVADQIRAAKKEAKASYKPTAEEQKFIDAAMKMTVSDFTTPAGLENLAKNYRGIFDAYTSYVRNATKSKGIENDTWWRAGDSEKIGDTLIANMNKENGLRSQSWSDFQVIHMMDYIAAVIELSTRNSKMQAYTKVPDYVELMGKTGAMINLSLIPARNYLGSLDYDSTEGMDYRKSLELRDKYHGTVGTICIGIDNNQIKQLFEDMTIDYVIPYHKSGMSAHVRKAMHLPNWSEYELYQSESNLSDAQAKANADKYGVELLDKSDLNYHKHTSFSEWFDLKEAQQIAKMENEHPSDPAKQKKYGVMYGGYMAMQNAANNYLKLCAERGLAPVFSHKNADFTGEDNYWKVLIDRKMVDNITGEVIEQKSIQPIFDEAEVLRILNDELERYPKVKEDQEYAIRRVTEKFLSGDIKGGMSSSAVAKAMQKPVDNISSTNIVEAGKEMDEVKLSDRNSEYMEAVNKGDMKTAQKLVDEAAKEAGYTRTLYHGTASKFNVFGFGRAGIYTTDNLDVAKTYGENIISLYGKQGANVLTIDAKRSPHYAIRVSKDILDFSKYPLMRGKELHSTNDISRIAFREGYDVVVIKDVYDNFSASSDNKHNALGTDVVYKDPNQVKSSAPVTYDDNGNVIPLSKRFDSDQEDIRYSLREVEPVQPASDKWQRTSTTSEVMARFPNLWNVAAEESETRNPTQITGTVKSYRKIYDYLKAEGFDGNILDASSGLGYGTRAGIEEYGFNVEDIEPYPDKNYHPKYKDYSKLNKKYDVIISNAVLNVIPQDQRDALVVKMGELLNEGGRIFINVRGKDVENASSKVAINEDLMEYYISNTGSYQKGFTKDELVAYLQDALGDGFTVEKSNMFGAVSAVVTKDRGIKYQDREDEGLSNRAILANAFEGIAQNDIEKQKILEYKNKIELINSEEAHLHEVNEKIKELSFAKGPKDTKKLKELHADATRTANRISTFDKQLLRLEASKPLQDVIDRERKMAYKRAQQKGKEAVIKARQKAAETQREIITRYQESRKKAVEGRHSTEVRNKIKRVVNELNALLTRQTKEKHIPLELQKPVADALDILNLDDQRYYESRIRGLEARIAEAKSSEERHLLQEELNKIIDHRAAFKDKIAGLKKAYEGIKTSTDPYIAVGYNENIAKMIDRVAEDIGDTLLRDMNMTQLQEVYDLYKGILKTVRDANKFFNEEKGASVVEAGQNVVSEIEASGKTIDQISKKKLERKKFFWNNLKPVYAFKKLGSKTLENLFGGILKGQGTWAKDVSEAKDFFERTGNKYGYKKWDFKKKFDFVSNTGKAFSLNLQQMMSLYAYSKRDQAFKHLTDGGFVFDNKETIKKNGKEYVVNTAQAYNISAAMLQQIVGKLSTDQRMFVDEMQKYLSETMGAKGNEVSRAMYDIELFREAEGYFPLKSAKQFLYDRNEVTNETRQLVNSGFTKPIQPGANNPIILTGFMEVWANHVNDMSMYHAFVMPIENFNKVYNFQFGRSEDSDSKSVKSAIQDSFTEAANQYIEQLLKDINGGARVDSREGWYKTMLARWKKAKVMGSWSVVVQQPSAIGRAYAEVDFKYFVNPKKISKPNKERAWEQLKKYAPVAIIKEMGYFDTDMGQSTAEFIKGEKTLMDKIDDAFGWMPAKADEITWVAIWDAVKRETKAKHKDLNVNSEEFLKIAGERFTEVIDKTQVYDSVLSRSGYMRSKSSMVQTLVSFMAEPTTSANMVRQAISEFKAGNNKKGRAYIASVGVSLLFNSVLSSFIYAMRDDDEDERYYEKYIEAFVKELVDSINPLTYSPIVKDFWSILQGFGIDRPDMDLVNDLYDSIDKTIGNIKDLAEGINDGTLSKEEIREGFKEVGKEAWSALDEILFMSGIAAGNIHRDVEAIIKTIGGAKKGIKGSDEYLEHSQRFIHDKITDAVVGQLPWNKHYIESRDNKLLDGMVSGDKVYLERLKKGYSSEDAYNNAVKAVIKKGVIGGEFSESQAKTYLVDYIGLEPDDAEGYIHSWKFEEKWGFAWSDRAEAYANGQIKEDKLKQAVMEYKEFSAEETDKAEKEVEKIKFKAENGFNYEDRADAYKNEEITKEQLKKALMEVDGKTSEEANIQIEIYNWQKQGIDIGSNSTDAVKDYIEYCEPVNVPKKEYMQIRNFSNKTENDKDANGKSISYSAVKKIMAEINKLNLTNKQKTAIAKTLWKDSTVNKYKLW